MSARDTHAAWERIAEHYRQLATARKAEGLGVQLACLTLAEYCAHLWVGSTAGPSLAMVAIAEHIVGGRVDDVVAAELTKIAEAREDSHQRSLS